MAEIVWTGPAREDLKEIVSYIQRDSLVYASAFAFHLEEHVKQLEIFPESGRYVPEDATKTYRELLFGDYRIVYRHEKDVVTIITVIHGARRLPF